MKAQKPSQGAQLTLVVVALVAVAAAGYLFLIAPKRASATEAKRTVEATQVQIDALRAAAASAPGGPTASPVDAAELFRLTKAMPDRAEMSEVILELNRVATATGIRFESIAPAAATLGQGYQVLPIALTFEGNFYNLSDFLFRLRNLVAVRDGELSASGRLFNVQSISFGAGTASFPQLVANVTVNAFVYGDGSTPAAASATGDAPPPAAPPATTSALPAAGAAS